MPDSQQTRILPDELRATAAPAPGTILRKRYRLETELGRGGMGTVFRATISSCGAKSQSSSCLQPVKRLMGANVSCAKHAQPPL